MCIRTEDARKRAKPKGGRYMNTREYPKPVSDEPTLDEMMEMFDDGLAEATDGCCVEPDGVCQHGYPSWLIELGYI